MSSLPIVQSPPVSANNVSRKRKAHRKSRQGCGNCKIRRVKCDERRPDCRKCAAFGVSCNFDGKTADLQLLSGCNPSFNVGIRRFSPTSSSPSPLPLPTPMKSTISLGETILSMVNSGQARSISASTIPEYHEKYHYEVDGRDLELLVKFQTRTLQSISTDSTYPVYQNEIIRLTLQHPFLLHMVLTITLMHDRFISSLSSSSNTISTTTTLKQSSSEAFHWYVATTLFRRTLSSPTTVHANERDPIWICAILLGAISFSFIEAHVAEEAWPLKPASPLDLDWLRISDGKKEVWKLANPLREGSVFRKIGIVYDQNVEVMGIEDMISEGSVSEDMRSNLPLELIELYNLTLTSLPSSSITDQNHGNPYSTAMSVLRHLFSIVPSRNIPRAFPPFIAFITRLQPSYKALLERKDPLALLILAWWYGKIYECEWRRWWVQARTRLECQAICIYLERRWQGREVLENELDVDIYTMKRLLQWPKKMCGFE